MSTPFDVAKQVSNNLGGFVEDQSDRRNIDEILESVNTRHGNIDSAMEEMLTRVSPRNRDPAIRILQEKRNRQIQKQNQGEYDKIATSLEQNNEGSTLHKNIADIIRSNLPDQMKEKLIKEISGAIPFKVQTADRLNTDSILKRHNDRIKELEREEEAAFLHERGPIKKALKAARRERDKILDFKAINEKNEREIQGEELKAAEELEIENNPPEEEGFFKRVFGNSKNPYAGNKPQMTEQPQNTEEITENVFETSNKPNSVTLPPKPKTSERELNRSSEEVKDTRIVFSKDNPKHVEIFKLAVEKFKNDKEKVNAYMNKTFRL